MATLLELARALDDHGVILESAHLYRIAPLDPIFELRADVRFGDAPLSAVVRYLADRPDFSGLVLRSLTAPTTYVVPI